MANAYLQRTISTAPTLQTKVTISYWCKRSGLGSWGNGGLAGGNSTATTANNNWQCGFIDTDKFYLWNNDVSMNLISTRRATDTNAWYHVVWSLDSTQSTAADRAKLYINGVQETVFDTANYPTQNGSFAMCRNGNFLRIGRYANTSGTDYYFDGLISHFHIIDGTTYQASTFGSTDSTTGEWEINTSPSVNYGNNGVFILKDDNSNLDRSGNGLNFTTSGTITKTEDCPNNVFATLDKLNYKTSALTYSNGNTTVSFPGAWVFALGNLGVSSGKYYWEALCNSGNNANSYFGICAEMVPEGAGFYNNSQNGAIMYKVGGGETYIDGSYNSSGYSPSINNTDTVGLALDLDSATKTLKIYKNGSLLSSGGTINLSSYYNDTLVFPCFSGNSSSASCSFNVNFGNGAFGSTQLTGTTYQGDGNIGIFKYQPPTGYTALSTKGLNE